MGLGGFISPHKYPDCRTKPGGCKLLIRDSSLISFLHFTTSEHFDSWVNCFCFLNDFKEWPSIHAGGFCISTHMNLQGGLRDFYVSHFHSHLLTSHIYIFRDWIHLNEFIFICGSEYKIRVNITEHSSALNWLNICE